MSSISATDLDTLTDSVARLMLTKKYRLATAESCTGGWLSKAITDLAGSSGWFECALVTYSNRAKHKLLGVDMTTLDQFGAVSEATVKAMVLGLLERCDADIGVSISGIAGPEGGSDDKPVGTVWIAWARTGELIEAIKFQFEGNRESIRLQAVYEALVGVKRLIDNE
ncbi:MAG: CinA family protein [Gammaproteobacteria bacterium]|nr:CinA family protein [Gammaproteobacteria bacterium]